MLIDGLRASDRAIERVLAYYAAFNRGDVAAQCALLSEDVQHHVSQGRLQVGRSAFGEFLQGRQRCYREQVRDVVVMATPDGRRAAAEYTIDGDYLANESGMPAAHGQRYVLQGGAFFELREGAITRISNHFNQQDWLRQVEPSAA